MKTCEGKGNAFRKARNAVGNLASSNHQNGSRRTCPPHFSNEMRALAQQLCLNLRLQSQEGSQLGAIYHVTHNKCNKLSQQDPSL